MAAPIQAQSMESQDAAGQRALRGAFSTQVGWVDQRSHPLYAEEKEKVTMPLMARSQFGSCLET